MSIITEDEIVLATAEQRIATLERALRRIKNGSADERAVVIAAEALGEIQPDRPLDIEDTPEG